MSKLTPHELALLTVKDLEKRKLMKKKGIKDADSFLADHRLKSFKNMSKIRCKTYRGK